MDQHYPDTAPGSPDPDQAPDDNKKGSRVIVRASAQKRIDSALGGKRPDAKGRMVHVDREISRSYDLLQHLFETVPAELDEAEGAKEKGWRRGDVHRLATRFVLLRANSAGGYQELEKLRRLARDGDWASKAVARMCGRVIRGVLDELDRRGYWLGWGTDDEEAERQQAAADRRKRAGVLATAEGQTGAEAIAAYHDLMLKTGHTVGEAEEATMEHFGCKRRKVQYSVSSGAA